MCGSRIQWVEARFERGNTDLSVTAIRSNAASIRPRGGVQSIVSFSEVHCCIPGRRCRDRRQITLTTTSRLRLSFCSSARITLFSRYSGWKRKLRHQAKLHSFFYPELHMPNIMYNIIFAYFFCSFTTSFRFLRAFAFNRTIFSLEIFS